MPSRLTTETLAQQVDHWVKTGVLSLLDRAFLFFLRDLDNQASPLVWVAGALTSRQLSHSHVCLDMETLMESAALDGLSSYTANDWLQALQNSAVVGNGAGATPLVLDRQRLYLRRYWQYEQFVAAAIKRRVQQTALNLPDDLPIRLQRLFHSNTTSPDWQKIACALALRSRFSIITGGPGTGKTTTVTRLLALLVEIASDATNGQSPLKICLAAPTGKAAARVTESIRKELEKLPVSASIKHCLPEASTTLHRLLGSRPNSRLVAFNRRNPLPADIVIVDEASMIDLEMMAALLEALAEKTQLILLGDKDQLASVEAGYVMGNLCRGIEHGGYSQATLEWIARYSGEVIEPLPSQSDNPLHQQIVMLRHSHRFQQNSGIGQLALAVNGGLDCELIWQAAFADIDRICIKDNRDERLQALIGCTSTETTQGYALYLTTLKTTRPQPDDNRQTYDAWAQRVLESLGKFQLLCALRNGPWGVAELNRYLQLWLFPEQNPDHWYEGRPVMVMQNDYSLGLMNGDVGITLTDRTNKLAVVFKQADGQIKWISPSRLSGLESAFAITVHKAQGSEFDHVALLLPNHSSAILTRELIYTGITRAKKHFTLLYSNPGVFRQALQTQVRRSGGLESLLAD